MHVGDGNCIPGFRLPVRTAMGIWGMNQDTLPALEINLKMKQNGGGGAELKTNGHRQKITASGHMQSSRKAMGKSYIGG